MSTSFALKTRGTVIHLHADINARVCPKAHTSSGTESSPIKMYDFVCVPNFTAIHEKQLYKHCDTDKPTIQWLQTLFAEVFLNELCFFNNKQSLIFSRNTQDVPDHTKLYTQFTNLYI